MDRGDVDDDVAAATTLCATLRPPASRTTGTLRTVDPQQRRELRTRWTSASAEDPRHLCECTPKLAFGCTDHRTNHCTAAPVDYLELDSVPDENSPFEPTVCKPRTQRLLSGVRFYPTTSCECLRWRDLNHHAETSVAALEVRTINFILETTTDA